MIVRCVKLLPDQEDAKRLGDSYFPGKQEWHVKIGEEYLVYSMSVYKGNPWVHVISEVGLYLLPVPMCLFEIVNPKISKYWEIKIEDDYRLLFGPEPFLAKYFIEDLVERVEEAVKEFNRFRVLLEDEHKINE